MKYSINDTIKDAKEFKGTISHPVNALREAQEIAVAISTDKSATNNERILAQCLIALARNCKNIAWSV